MFEDFSLASNFGIFAAAAAAVWIAGTRIARYADSIAEKTGIGRELLGILLLGGVTSLPEMAVASTASLAGHPALSVNDLLGSAAINVVIIALADAAIGRDAITSVLASPGVLLQGVLGILLLALVVGATMSIDVPLFGASAWTWLLLCAYGCSVWVIAKSHSQRAWKPVGRVHEQSSPAAADQHDPLGKLAGKTTVAAAVVLAAGFFLAKTGEAIAEQTGLGTSFVGAVLLAASTSLPELSTVLAAVRLKRYEMAVADVFGTNLFNVTILFAVDLLYDGPPVLREVGPFAGFGALLAIVLTSLYLVGMLERRDRTVARMGYDSLAVLGVYFAGIVVLWTLR
ncbi:MAG: sodium:calcium antiporter [Betaproteobacteria bacterium]|nr:sodium:calcium antiporter [Betaproteobacteria bacterium]